VRARLFSFPNPVNEVAARLVAAGVVVMCAAELVTHQRWLLVVLAYGFWARVLTGPKLSPLGAVVTRVVVPRLDVEPRLVPGPPKRFAQGIGATLTTLAVLAWAIAGWTLVADALIAMVLVAATLESVFGYCLGCKVFALLMRVRVIPESVCLECADISARLSV
jgi:uncharacterized protein DUF4395